MLLGAVLGLAVLIPVAWSYYREATADIRVSILALGKSKSIKGVGLNVRRGTRGQDELDVRLSLVPLLADDRLLVSVPTSFRLYDQWLLSDYWHVEARTGDEGETDYYLIPTGQNHETGCMLRFRGPVFPEGPSVDVRLRVFSGYNGVASDLPTEVTFSGLDGLALDQLIPEPDARTASFLLYTAPSWQAKTSDNSLTIRGTDRSAASANQFRLFVVATLIGVMVSIVVSGLQAVLLEYEGNWRRRPLQTGSIVTDAQPVPPADG
jgi:hypothetical protein